MKLAIIGDSISTIGHGDVPAASHWSKLLGAANGYAAADVLNFAAGGDTTVQARARIPAVIAADPDVCIIMLMANDRGDSTPAVFDTNLRYMVYALQTAGIKVVLASPPVWRMGVIAYKPFLESMQKVALDYSCHFVDIFRDYAYMLMGDVTTANTWYSDNIHQTAAGNARINTILSKFNAYGWFLPGAITPATSATERQLAAEDLMLNGSTPARLTRFAASL